MVISSKLYTNVLTNFIYSIDVNFIFFGWAVFLTEHVWNPLSPISIYKPSGCIGAAEAILAGLDI